MKHLILGLISFLLPASALAASNNISMVTYFPVPYMSYSTLRATQTGAMCLSGNACDLTLPKTLQIGVGGMTLKSGRLSFQGNSLITPRFEANGNESEHIIKFNNTLRVFNDITKMHLLETEGQAKIASSLNLNGKAFPQCGGMNISWQKLGGKVFLVCGQAEEDTSCTADARTEWDVSAKKCKCPSGVYHNGACCSDSTPKSDTRCWKENSSEGSTTYEWQAMTSDSSLTQNIANDGVYSLTCSNVEKFWQPTTTIRCPNFKCRGSCKVSCRKGGGGGEIGGTDLPPGDDMSDEPDAVGLGSCDREGAKCLAGVQIRRTRAGCDMGFQNNQPYLYCDYTYHYAECVKVTTPGTTSYQKLWDSSDTPYGCGH